MHGAFIVTSVHPNITPGEISLTGAVKIDLPLIFSAPCRLPACRLLLTFVHLPDRKPIVRPNRAVVSLSASTGRLSVSC